MRVYLDSAPLIYLVENAAPYGSLVMTRLAQPGITQLCSELTRLECRVKPIQDGEVALLTAFDSYFAEIITTIVPLSRQVLDLATELRAFYNFKTPDALHLAAAIVAKCDLFLTNDRQLTRCTEITVETII
ncbi:MAG: type II toxin-antitoxin system VapC family toxin [Anaerolineae bacterium]|nr:type II toxin-antitoxin system VapC family toxin [Anaerolineae bacterium]